MPQFDVSSFSSQLFWLAVVFAVLYFLISKFIAPKAESILTSRNKVFEDNVNNAEEYNYKVQATEALLADRMIEVNSKVESMQKQMLGTLDVYFSKKKTELSSVLAQKHEHAIDDMNIYIEQFHAQQPDFTIRLAAFIIKKLTNKPADTKLLKKIHGNSK